MTVHVLNLEHFAGRSAYNLHDEPGRPPRSVGLGGGKERRRSCQSRSCREAGSAWRRRGDERGPSDPAGVPAFAGGPGSSRAGTGNLLCSSGTEGRHRYGARRGVLAAMPYQHHDHSALQRSPPRPGVSGGHGADHLPAAVTRGGPRAAPAQPGRCSTSASPRLLNLWSTWARKSSP